jgi:hypothetical protein
MHINAEAIMGNRAVLTFEAMPDVGIYVHWNGDPESVLAFIDATKDHGSRPPGNDPTYALARLVQTITLFFDGGLSVGIGPTNRLDCDNYDNGQYWIDNDWGISRRSYPDRGPVSLADLRGTDLARYSGIYESLRAKLAAPKAATELLAESEQNEHLDTDKAIEVLQLTCGELTS